jgi:hypothetical protein
MDKRILTTIITKFKVAPVGISTIATACGGEGRAKPSREVYAVPDSGRQAPAAAGIPEAAYC